MNVCLINPPDKMDEDPLWDEPLGLLYLGAILEQEGIEVEIVDMNFYDDLEKYSLNVAIITEESRQISYKELLDAAEDIGKQINDLRDEKAVLNRELATLRGKYTQATQSVKNLENQKKNE